MILVCIVAFSLFIVSGVAATVEAVSCTFEGKIFYTEDGTNWTDTGFVGFGACTQILFVPEKNMWVASGGRATTTFFLAYSRDGRVWQTDGSQDNFFSPGSTASGLCYGDGVFISVSSQGAATVFGDVSIARSLDGGNYTGVANTPFFHNFDGSKCAFSTRLKRFVATGMLPSVAYSDTMGQSWVSLGNVSAFESVSGTFGASGIFYGNLNGLFVALAASDSPTGISWSDDGVTWTPISFQWNTYGLTVVFANGTWIVSGNCCFFSSLDLVSWTAVSQPMVNIATYAAYSSRLDRWFLTGGNGPTNLAISTGNLFFSNASFFPSTMQMEGVDVRRAVLVDSNTTLSGVIVGDVEVFPGQTATVVGPLVVTGSLRVDGVLVVGSGSSVSVNGTLVLSQGALSVTQGAVVSASSIVFGGPLLVTVTSSSSLTVVVASYDSFSGTASSVTASAVSDCRVTQTGTPSYGAGALTVTVEVACAGLSPGAVAGIVVGSVLGAIAVTLVVVALLRRQRATRSAKMAAQIRERDVADARASKPG